MKNRVASVVAFTLVGMLAATSSQAAPLNLIPKPPDIIASFIDVAYNHSTWQFSATGWALDLDLDGVAPPDYSISTAVSNFQLTAMINNAGQPLGGALNIGGKIPALGATSGVLLTGTLFQIGYPNPPGGEIFEFVFNTTGGDLAGIYGTRIGVILNALDSGFGGAFNHSFSNTGMGTADVFVPSPAAALGGIALLGCVVALRKRRAN